jgi:hypothetical protein
MRPALPLADAPAFRDAARRTAAAYSALALLAAAALAFAYLSLRPSPPPVVAARGGGTIPVIDISGSISPAGYQVVRRMLERLAARGGPVGLVLFSDAVQEALPPGTPARELRAYVRALRPQTGQLIAANPDAVQANPWDASFSRGTRISVGLALARRLLDRAGGGRVVLLSDLLDDESDTAALRHELVGYARDPAVRLQVVRLPGAGAAYLEPYRKLVGRSAVSLRVPAAVEAPRRPEPLRPWLPVLIGAVAVVLAIAELVAVPLVWRSTS